MLHESITSGLDTGFDFRDGRLGVSTTSYKAKIKMVIPIYIYILSYDSLICESAEGVSIKRGKVKLHQAVSIALE